MLRLEFRPWLLLPSADYVVNLVVKGVELVKVLDLGRCFLQLGIALVLQSEEILASFVDIEVSFFELILVLESLQSIRGLLRGDALDHWTFVFEILSQLFDIISQFFDVRLKPLKILPLVSLELPFSLIRQNDESLPFLL